MRQLFAVKGFMLFISIAFINAFVDLGHKILIQNTVFKIFDGETQILLTALVNALILLPFILMMTPSSYAADKYPKNIVMKFSALAAVIITTLITVSYYLGWFWFAFILTLLLSIQSAIYSPAKYGYIKELVGVKQLASGNGAVQAVTTTAILLGTVAFSAGFEWLLIDQQYHSPEQLIVFIAPLGFVLIALSVIEWILASRLLHKPAGQPDRQFDKRAYLTGQSAWQILQEIRQNRVIFRAIIGLAIFWSLCQVLLAAFPAFAKDVAGIHNTVLIQGVMAFAGIGIVLGAVLAGRVSRNYIETGLIPISAIGITVTIGLVGLAVTPLMQAINFFVLGFFGGLYLVPLNALIQYHANTQRMGRILAGSNFVQNIGMLSFLLVTMAAAFIGVASLGIFTVLLIVAAVGSIYTIHTLPQSLARFVVSRLFSLRYRLSVIGVDKLPAEGGVLLLGNHISWIDWAVIQMACPRPIRFVMAKSIYERWYFHFILRYFNILPVTHENSEQTLNTVRDYLNQGEVVCLFPEGGISWNGHLGEFQPDFEVAAKGANAVIVPFYLRGMWGSRFSRSSDRLKAQRDQKRSVDLIMTFGDVMPINADRFTVKQAVIQLSVEAWTAYTDSLETLAEGIIQGLKQTGIELAAADITGTNLSGYRFLTAAILFSKTIPKHCHQNLGILMPSSNAGAIANVAALLRGKTVVNFNFTASQEALSAAINKSNINVMLTSRLFIKKLEERGFDSRVLHQVKQVFYMEDIKENIRKTAFVWTLILVRFSPISLLKKRYLKKVKQDNAAMILFSSGSEGPPKGISLSHRNIMSNIKQVADVLNTEKDDVIMSTLPLFHAFGLTVTTLLPLVESLPIICHPDPTDARQIARGIARYRGTILCGTSTFLRMYIRDRKVEPLMLDSLRIVVAGAEKLNPDVRDQFKLKFNKEIYEGYGATETTPVASVNMPDKLLPDTLKTQVGNKPGSVGLPLPGTQFRIVDPETLADLPAGEDGLIMIGGNQVMLGYVEDPDKTASVITEQNRIRWYHTGDKGHLDPDGFLVIVDRYSRFAKIGGEMISLGAIEEKLKLALDDNTDILATTIADEKKGEKIVLLYVGEIDEAQLKQAIHESLPALMQPSKIVQVDEIPRLGSGKTDFSKAKQLANG